MLESRVFHERAKDKVRPACAHRQCARLSSLQSGRGGHGQDDERVAPFCRLLLAHVHLVMVFFISNIYFANPRIGLDTAFKILFLSSLIERLP